MFQTFSERYERGSILLNSNPEFGEWVNIFHDKRMTAAIIDRLINNSQLAFNGKSYRYETQKMKTEQKKQKTH